MKKLAMLVTVLILSAVQVGCGKSQPKAPGPEVDSLVVNYFKALENGKIDEAVSFYSQDAKAKLEKAGGKGPLAASFSDLFKTKKGIKNIRIVKKDASDDTVKISFLFEFNDGSSAQGMLVLVNENGAWKILK